jgi:hypothetical protein
MAAESSYERGRREAEERFAAGVPARHEERAQRIAAWGEREGRTAEQIARTLDEHEAVEESGHRYRMGLPARDDGERDTFREFADLDADVREDVAEMEWRQHEAELEAG